MDVELKQLAGFLVLAEELHFGRAAERLGVAQPALSQQLQRLERALGTKLLHRTSRRVSLTVAGILLQERARYATARLRRDFDDVVRVGAGETTSATLGFVSSAADAGVLDHLASAAEGVRLQLREGFTDVLLADLGAGEVDVAVVRDAPPQDGVVLTELLREPFVAVVPPTHPSAGRTAVHGSELAEEAFVLYPRAAGSLAYERNLDAVVRHGARPRIAQEATSWPAIFHLVSAGWGITLAPRSAARAATGAAVLTVLDAPVQSCLASARREDEDRRPVLALERRLVTEMRRFAEQASADRPDLGSADAE